MTASLRLFSSYVSFPRVERFVCCARCGLTVGLREDGTKRAHGMNASPAACRNGGEVPTDAELGGGRE